jgi:hypothetical protein
LVTAAKYYQLAAQSRLISQFAYGFDFVNVNGATIHDVVATGSGNPDGSGCLGRFLEFGRGCFTAN